jgi:tetratricopeptide (TPR) repeat protein
MRLSAGKQLAKTENSTLILWVASLLLIASACVGWVVTPLQGKIRAYAFPFMSNISLTIGINNPLHIGSFGVILIALGILTIAFIILRATPRLIFYLGAASVIVCVSFIGNMFFLNSEMIEALVDQNIQVTNIKSFSDGYLRGNAKSLRPEEDISTDTLLDKLDAGIRYLGLGWYAALISSLLILIVSYRKQASKSMRWDALGLALTALVVTAGLSAGTLKAEYDRLQGDRSLAQGELQKAIALYESAVRWDANLSYNPRYVYSVGAVCYTLSWHDRPEIHIYLGDNLVSVQNFYQASREYEVASALRADFLLARRNRVNALITMGLNNYSAKKIYTALWYWQQALQLDPNQIQALFFLVKASLDINARDQLKTIMVAEEILEKTKDRLIKADTYVLLGDSYYKQREYAKAREMYGLSRRQYDLVKRVINFLAMKGLQGV